MTTAAHVCLNMIVRNEAARIERCLRSVLPYIDSYVIVDTGSTDDTTTIIHDIMLEKQRGIQGHVLTNAPFINFEQARNLALLTGRVWLDTERFKDAQLFDSLPLCYFLLMDADMELRVDDPQWREKLTGADAYDVVQRAGSLSYHNTRLLRHDAPAKYVGVTHEYLDGARSEKLDGIWFQDHADGANRPDKCERDIRLLLEALKTDPNNGRSHYYLAQSYKDAGMPVNAAHHYQLRVKLGGWDEEVWHAQLQAARCLKEIKDERWLAEMLLACDMRPSRAEPFYELAKYYREKGKNNLAVMFAEQPVGYPGDLLFVEDFVYDTGLREEYAIAAFYDKRTRASGFAACNWLTLDPKTPEHSRELARNNLFYYMPKLADYVSSFRARRIPWVPYDGWVACNPSVVAGVSGLLVNVRAVNYRIREDGSYDMQGDTAIRTRNCLVWLDHGLDFIREQEIIWNRPEPAYKDVIGLEDIRLFHLMERHSPVLLRLRARAEPRGLA
jgi:glycosyltransferase involved in cell wall biosynthesis